MSGCNRCVDLVAVERAILCKGGDGTIDPVEQRADLPTIIDLVPRQSRCDDPPRVGVRSQVQLAPSPAPLAAGLFDGPLAGAAWAQAGALRQQLHRLRSAVRP